jgi:hypothetical protein
MYRSRAALVPLSFRSAPFRFVCVVLIRGSRVRDPGVAGHKICCYDMTMLGRAKLYIELAREDVVKSECIRHLNRAKEEIDKAIESYDKYFTSELETRLK